jgi:L-histidine Nalpha-methyltransferase
VCLGATAAFHSRLDRTGSMDSRPRTDPAAPRLETLRPDPRLTLLVQPQRDQRQDLRNEVAAGLAQVPKRIAPRFFYDAEGSDLFERITATPEYYPTRTEAGILRSFGAEIVAAVFGGGLSNGSGANGADANGAGSNGAGTNGSHAAFAVRPIVIELGSGSSAKTRLLLDALGRTQPLTYIPIDVSAEAVRSFGLSLLGDYPALEIRGLACDYHGAMDLLRSEQPGARLFLFLGSSLGNYDPPDARHLLSLVRSAMGPADRFLLGLDLKKDPAILNAAYNDAEGVTAAFNMNLLARINRELGGHFDLGRFRHVAFYNESAARIEMHLESSEDQVVSIDALGRGFAFRRGERMHTENSYKYGPAELTSVLEGTGLTLERQWQDARGWFGLNLLAPV